MTWVSVVVFVLIALVVESVYVRSVGAKRGNSMNLKTFREITKNLPDTTEIAVCDGIDTFEVYDHPDIYPPVLEHEYLVVMDMGQRVDLQLELDIREASKEL